MIVMPANASGWMWHSLARETGRIGHLYSPGAQRGPWPWLPYALDNGSFSCWDMKTNTFDRQKFESRIPEWRRLIFWATSKTIKPRWAIAPDIVGSSAETLDTYKRFAPEIKSSGLPVAIAVQDGMTEADVKALEIVPDVICVGGSTDWKWQTAERWIKAFKRVHVLRCNSPEKLLWLDSLGCESTDGTGWNRGDRHRRTKSLEDWARSNPDPKTEFPLWPYASKAEDKQQMTFA